jgi:hypothetical protein
MGRVPHPFAGFMANGWEATIPPHQPHRLWLLGTAEEIHDPCSLPLTPVTAVTSTPPTECYCTFAPREIQELGVKTEKETLPFFLIFYFFCVFHRFLWIT